MSLYKKLNCICGHPYENHSHWIKISFSPCYTHLHTDSLHEDFSSFCSCQNYDPAGHNPELENVLCPECEIVHLEKMGDWYVCVACSHTMTEKQVLELVG